jgi:hypothetical protein
MGQICGRVPGILQKTGGLTVAINTNSIALPSDFVARRTLTDSNQKPLLWLDTLAELQARFNADVTTGTPTVWTIFENKAYVYPKASAAAALTMYYCYKDSSANSITLPDIAEEALVEGVCSLVELSRGVLGQISPDTVTHKTFFEEQIKMLQGLYGWR